MTLYLIFALPAMLLAMYAQSRVRNNFQKYSKVANSRGLTGAQVARTLLDSMGLHEVAVEETEGTLSDHYDPRSKVLRLSPQVYRTPSIAAAGVAAHEMGHAMQDARNYAPLSLRSAMVPSVQFGSRLGPLVLIGGIMLASFTGSQIGIQLAWVGFALFAATVVFALVTLPVEFDASRRAKKLLVSQGILVGNENEGVDKVLDAAALTYVAAAVSAVSTLLYYGMILLGGRRQ